MDVTLIGQQSTHITVDEAFEYCAALTTAHYENFPVASLFMPEDKRQYIQAIYAFSRTADDFADELLRSPAQRLEDLEHWGQQLEGCYLGEANHPVFIALAETIKAVQLPIQPLRDLLTAFRRDVTQNRYETFGDLLGYCACSANPVGRLVLHVFGHRDEGLLALSDSICTALQLTNFWQDIDVDRGRNRLYIPLEDLRRFEYPVEAWEAGRYNAAFRELLQFQVNRTIGLFNAGAALPSLVEKDIQIELKLVWFGGMAVLKKIVRQKYDVFRARPTLSSFNKVAIMGRALFRSNLSRYGNSQKPKEPWDLT